jgi:hypothetical protein
LRSYLKNTHHKKRAGGMAQDEGLEFTGQYCKKQKQKQKKMIFFFFG